MKNLKRWLALTVTLAAFVALIVVSRTGSRKPEAQQPSVRLVDVAQTVPQPATTVQEAAQPPEPLQLLVTQATNLQGLPPPVSVTRNPDGSVTTVYKPELMWMTKLKHGHYAQTLAGIPDDQLKSLGMTRNQAFKAQEIYDRTVTNRLNIERAIAEVKPLSPHEVLITIPEYSRGLEEALYSELTGTLGEKITEKSESNSVTEFTRRTVVSVNSSRRSR